MESVSWTAPPYASAKDLLREALQVLLPPIRFAAPIVAKSEPSKNYVYFIQDFDSGLIKIGTSRNVPARLKQLQTSTGSDLRILGMTLGSFPLEQNLHWRFRGDRRRGEWFAPSSALVEYIRSLNKVDNSDSSSGMISGLLSCCG